MSDQIDVVTADGVNSIPELAQQMEEDRQDTQSHAQSTTQFTDAGGNTFEGGAKMYRDEAQQALADLTGEYSGGASVSDRMLLTWEAQEAYSVAGNVTYNVNRYIKSADIHFPDGETGTFERTAFDEATGKPVSWEWTHTASGKTVVQPAITYDAAGRITDKPAAYVTV